MPRLPIDIKSKDNQQVKNACVLAESPAQRKQQGLFFAEGLRLCQDLAQRHGPQAVFATKEMLEKHPELERMATDVYVVSEAVAEKLSATKTTQGVYCLFTMPKPGLSQLNLPAGTLLCEAVQDPANVGAMVRSAAGLGFGAVVLLPGCADPYSQKALRASMGAVGRTALLWDIPAQEVYAYLREANVYIWAATPAKNALPYTKMHRRAPHALMLGNEGRGLSQEALANARENVYIPMHNGVESLNAAAAAAVLMAWLKAD